MNILNDIQKMDNDQLNQVIDAVRMRRQYLATRAVRSYTIGDSVKFRSSKTGKIKEGNIIKVGRKYITIDCGPFDNWRVPANMVERA